VLRALPAHLAFGQRSASAPPRDPNAPRAVMAPSQPVDWLSILLAAVAGVVVGVLLTPFLGPWARRAERAGRAVAGETPVDVLTDTDQAVIWAGSPPWVGFSYYFEDGLPSEEPPEVCFDWSQWVYKRGGVDVALTMLQVTIQAKLNATVVIDTPIVRIVDRVAVERGVIATCPAGGADIVPRHFEVDLDMFDPPVISYMNEDHQVVRSPGFKLASGDVERFHIWAYAKGSELVEWTLELPLIVNGTRMVHPIQGPTDLSFRTLGREAGVGEELLRSGHDWIRR